MKPQWWNIYENSCLHPRGLEKPEIDSIGQSTPSGMVCMCIRLYMAKHTCGTRMQVKIWNFEKFKIHISTRCIQTKLSTWKHFNLIQGVFSHIDSEQILKSLEDIQVFSCKNMIVLVCVMCWRHLTPRGNVILSGLQWCFLFQRGGGILTEISTIRNNKNRKNFKLGWREINPFTGTDE